MKRIAGYVVVTIILVFASLWVLAQVDLADLHQFLPGTKIEAGLMNENFELVQDAIEALQVQAEVASLNGQNGAIVLEAGDNIDIDDSEEGTIVNLYDRLGVRGRPRPRRALLHPGGGRLAGRFAPAKRDRELVLPYYLPFGLVGLRAEPRALGRRHALRRRGGRHGRNPTVRPRGPRTQPPGRYRRQ